MSQFSHFLPFANWNEKTLKGVGLLCKLNTLLPRQSLRAIYKSFIRPLLDYVDVIYDQPLNKSLSNRIKFAQYKAALAITLATQGSSREKYTWN